MNTPKTIYKMMMVDSSLIITPHDLYQRDRRGNEVQKIVVEFSEYIANEPKVSFRDGRYFAFDGQHTIEARKLMNGGRDLPILCKVYFGLTEQKEALLFAKQNGVSTPITAGERIRAEIFGGEENAVAFFNANAALGVQLDYHQQQGENRIGCIKTAYNAYCQFGEKIYMEAISIIVAAWDGEPSSFHSGNISGITWFVDLYHGEYDRHRLIRKLSHVDPLTIPREGLASGVKYSGNKKYLSQVLDIYNGTSVLTALPVKF
ncbi:MAG: type II toxin-antitoxin system PemK/MazF family toxin [Oscillospiraceae bacterium]|nr:type II toxin-antitoxin system PemK/MazF family toxin [Oscillospiraceae bacterium]